MEELRILEGESCFKYAMVASHFLVGLERDERTNILSLYEWLYNGGTGGCTLLGVFRDDRNSLVMGG